MARKSINEKYALLSVFDKTGIIEFAKGLSSLGYKIISTGGTAKILSQSKIPIIPIEKITRNPESFDGRMKTISFQIESGILYDRNNSKHRREAKKLNIKPINVVVCNFYPFEQNKTIENIDIGGPTMVRAAAKNYEHVTVAVDPSDYEKILRKLEQDDLSDNFRKYLAGKAFRKVSFYDSQISNWVYPEIFPEEITIAGKKVENLRYGENPHQKAAFYISPGSLSPLKRLKKLWGRELSLMNITDINAGIEIVRNFSAPCAVVIKHNNPCGIALGGSTSLALKRAIEGDPESAFGGIIVLNKPFDLKSAREIERFKKTRRSNIDIIAAPGFDRSTIEFLSELRKSMGVYEIGILKEQKRKDANIKWVGGGFVLQEPDLPYKKMFSYFKVVTKKKPTRKQFEQTKTAWLFIMRTRSNSIIILDKTLPMTRGIGSGQTSRIKSVKIALEQAGGHTKDALLASDSFFPFDDCVKLAVKYKIGAIIQQGGSRNDQASIDAADKSGIAMVFTGRRAFWH